MWFPVIPEAPDFLCPKPPCLQDVCWPTSGPGPLSLLMSAVCLGSGPIGAGALALCVLPGSRLQPQSRMRECLGPVVCLSALRAHMGQQGGSQVHMLHFLSHHLWCERVQISHPWQKLFFRKVCRRHSVLCQSKVSSELKSPESSTGIGCEQPGQVPAQLLLGSGSTEKLLDSPGPSPGREAAVLFVGSEHGA